jgi:hypothetical protein
MRPIRALHPLIVLCTLAVAAAPLGSCNLTRYAIRKSGPVLGRSVSVLSSYKDPEMARQAAPALLVVLEGLLASDPENRTLLRLLCRGLYEYTFGFLQADYERLRETDPDAAEHLRRRARMQYVKVYELGLRLLRTHGVRITLQKTSKAEIAQQISRLDKRGVGALTWTALGAGSALLLGIDQPWLLQMIGKVPLLLRRAVALDPSYANALPVGALALYYGRDLTTGGSAIQSQRYFEQALRLTRRRYLLYLVLYARYWAWQFQSVDTERVGRGAAARQVPIRPKNKRALFVGLLKEALRFRLADAPEWRLPNTLAQRMAAELLRRADDFLGNQHRRGLRHAARGGRP